MEELTLIPRGERRLKPKWINRHIEFESGKEQVQGVTTQPIYMWELKFVGDNNTRKELEDFFNRHCGSRKTFWWTDSEGVKHEVRFAQDELDINLKYGLDDTGKVSPMAFECTVLLRKVI